MKRLMVVDDHGVVRDGIRKLLEGCIDIGVACEAATCDEGLLLLARHPVDVVVLDISMPDGSGLDALQRMKALRAEVPVLILSMHPEAQYALNALKAGASGYIEKTRGAQEIVRAIRAVLQGRTYFSSEVARGMTDAMAAGEMQKSPHEKLSRREFEIFVRLASGQTVSAIAASLSLSAKTVSTHRARVMSKMNQTSNAALTYYAIKNRLID